MTVMWSFFSLQQKSQLLQKYLRHTDASHDDSGDIFDLANSGVKQLKTMVRNVYITVIKLRTNILILSTLCHK